MPGFSGLPKELLFSKIYNDSIIDEMNFLNRLLSRWLNSTKVIYQISNKINKTKIV
jgi:hypothetical protein